MKTTKEHSSDKQIWEKWVTWFGKYGDGNIRLKAKFRATYTLDYSIVCDLFDDEEFMAHIKPNKILSKENTFMAFLYKAKTGIFCVLSV